MVVARIGKVTIGSTRANSYNKKQGYYHLSVELKNDCESQWAMGMAVCL